MRGGHLRTLVTVVVAVLFPSYRAVMGELRMAFIAPGDSRCDGEELQPEGSRA